VPDKPTVYQKSLAEFIKRNCIDSAKQAYIDALIAGLCQEGAFEASISALEMTDIDVLIKQFEKELNSHSN
tara:strand:+ start:773 stop:985 length:213 start_codon:yes stop_codon:yes gene_type:complete